MEKGSSKGESSSKTTESKDSKHESTKKSGDKRPADSSSRKFAIISPECINVIAESIGISDLSSNVLLGLAEDVSYKLREIIHNCNIALKNTKRRKLTTDDCSRVFETFNVPAIYGYSCPSDNGIDFVPQSDVFVSSDIEQDVVAIALSNMEFIQPKDQYVKGNWGVVELPDQPNENKDKQKDADTNPKPGTSTEKSSPLPNQPPEPGGKPDDPPPHLLNYYLQVAKVILSGSTPLLQIALNDLRTNPNIGPVCPYFLNLVTLSVNKLQRHVWLTDALLSTVKALVENQFIDPCCFLAANRAANSLLVLAIEPKIASNCDDLLLRSHAAELLSKVLLTWTIEMKQQMDIVKKLLQLLKDKNISLQSQYGAIVCLMSLGYQILLVYFWPVMEHYFPILEEKQKTCSSTDSMHVKGAILMAAELTYRKDWSLCSIEEAKKRLRLDFILYEYFGDAFVMRRQQYSKQRTIYPQIPPSVVTDYDFDYENWSPSYILQRKPAEQSTNPYVNKIASGISSPLNIYSVFNLPYKDRTRDIFHFEGFKQIDRKKLKRRVLDKRQITFRSLQHKLSGLWYKQNIYKSTRTIKYCVKLHTKCSTGDLFTLL